MQLNKQFQAGTFSILSLLFFSCSEQKKCSNVNPLLNEVDYKTTSYRKAVIDAIQKLREESVHYYFEKYVVEDGIEYIVAEVKSDDKLCAKVQLRIKPEIFLADIRRTKGKGYQGAELKGVHFESKLTYDSTNLSLSSIESIID